MAKGKVKGNTVVKSAVLARPKVSSKAQHDKRVAKKAARVAAGKVKPHGTARIKARHEADVFGRYQNAAEAKRHYAAVDAAQAA